jgi:hypothetical protein
VKEFLRRPEKFEQKGNGAYFTLVVNDPRRGALTRIIHEKAAEVS